MTIVGLMSGTSLDGITAAVVRFTEADSPRPHWELLHHFTRPYADSERTRISRVLTDGENDSITRLNFELGELFAAAALKAIEEAGLGREEISAIASHGQTIWHVPGVATLQLGEAAVITELTGYPVVSDFRVRDVAAGGQGAPLVPIADALLFASETEWRAIQNIGGIGNVTIVPPGGSTDLIRAFDTGPGVVMINGVVSLLTDGAESMDLDGKYSAGGHPVEGAIQEVLDFSFFRIPPPRSTGRELFSPELVARFVEQCRALRAGATAADVVMSAVELTARSIAVSYREFVREPISEVLLAGGGAKHPILRAAIARQLAPLRVRDFGELYCDSEAKEAVAFALLGLLHLLGRTGNVPSATGARGARVLGKLTPS